VRAFVAVAPSRQVIAEIARLQAELGEELPGTSWTGRNNLHITLVFFDALPPNAQPTVAQLLDEAASRVAAPSLRLSALGAFPSVSNPGVLWCGVQDERDGLSTLQRHLAESLRRLGVGFDDRPYSPHCTIGRVRRRWPGPVRKTFADLAASRATFQTEPWCPPSLHLYESRNGYHLLHQASFAASRSEAD
jgi:RNA 2',3'-cyclic 3'-phosphodiesterase